MDFEQQLEKAEKLPAPSLVGSSLRSADDSAHNNYIHPEKYLSSKDKKKKLSKQSKFKQSITASLDDLISEGALLGSQEDFEKFLDDDGHVKELVEYTPSQEKQESELFPDMKLSTLNQVEQAVPVGKVDIEDEDEVVIPPPESSTLLETSSSEVSLPAPASDYNSAKSFYSQEDYSTPNLSQYQLDNAIKDHLDLLSSIKSDDPHRLPKSDPNAAFRKSPKTPSFSATSTDFVAPPSEETTVSASEGLITTGTKDGLHTPFFHTERRSSSGSAVRSDRSRSRSQVKPHLARGDSYKNTHVEDPGKYELPAALAESSYPEEAEQKHQEENEEDDRRTRHSKPTMRESVAAAEAHAAGAESAEEVEQVHYSRDPSLVTSGDYTNFNVDAPTNDMKPSAHMYATRSVSSTNYLRSISRSRSRARRPIDHDNEKNDSNPAELVREGALVTDDPYSTISNIDEMVDGVLYPKKSLGVKTPDRFKQEISGSEPLSIQEEEEPEKSFQEEERSIDQKLVDKLDDLKLNSDIVPEDKKEGSGSVVSAKDIHVKQNELPVEHSAPVHEAEKVEASEIGDDKTVSDGEPKGPVVTAADIHLEKAKENVEQGEEEKTRDCIGEAEPVFTKDLHINESKDANFINEKEDPKLKDLVSESKDDKSKEIESKEPEVTEEISAKEKVQNDLDNLDDLDVSPEEIRKHLESLPIYVYTSLAGGMQIMQKTNRLATILQANGIKFEYRDLGTDEAAKKIWKRSSNGRLLPGVVRDEDIIGNYAEIDEANEEYKLHELLYETL